ncbi:MAG TPA: argininosuccinate lyase [bacterium]|nr:argininosuccinate lyase [bacterium]HPN43280.1 argininosuccinate lyase [bacterium]
MKNPDKIWGGRFSQKTASLMEEFSYSIAYDQKLFVADIAVNKAWAQALVQAGIYTDQEAAQIGEALECIQKDFLAGELTFSPRDEDIHSANERWLTERSGDLGARIHTGRSRNDQVVTDLRIYLRGQADLLRDALCNVQQVLTATAQQHIETIFPGQTHLRQAQPVSLAHYFLALVFQLQRDKERLLDARQRMNKMPLGSGAIAGAAFTIDRLKLAKELGFDAPTENSYDATSDRDFVIELLYVCAQIMLHLSRIAEDLIIWSSEALRFVEINEQYATGSSMMPQKKNPDSLELIRGKSARVIGQLVTGLTLMKGIPTAYVRDLQEDKEPVFDAMQQTILSVQIMSGVLSTIVINRQKMTAALDPALYATDVADYLVRKGMPFRKAHGVVGSLVSMAEKQQVALSKLDLHDYQSISPLFEQDLYLLFDPLASVNRRNISGGTGTQSIQQQLLLAEDLINA